jgi:hypothetical protein
MSTPPTIEPIYIADANERLKSMFVDEMFEQLVEEVEEEDSQTLKK